MGLWRPWSCPGTRLAWPSNGIQSGLRRWRLHSVCSADSWRRPVMATVSMSSADFEQPVGVFDSGIGGLSILRAIRAQMPEERIVYFGDQAHIPYGPRPLGQV